MSNLGAAVKPRKRASAQAGTRNFATQALRSALMSSVSILVAVGAGHALAEDRVNPEGTTLNSTVVLADGDSVTNNGVIDVANNVGIGYPGPDTGTIVFVLNNGTITSGTSFAVGINGNLGQFENTGILTGANGAFGAAGTVSTFNNSGSVTSTGNNSAVFADSFGSFANTGTITATGNSAVGVDGSVGSFENTGTLSGQGFEAVYVGGGVGSFVNGDAGVITNTDGLGNDGNGVSFNTDLVNGGAVSSFTNNGLIQGDPNSNSAGVAFFDNSNADPTAFQTGSFTNTGTITGANNAVQSRGGFGSFNNSGLISGGQSGLNSNGDIGTFTNSGTIVGGLETGANINGHVNGFTNSGTITGNGSDAVFIGSGVDSFSNEASGLIQNLGANPGFGNAVSFNTDLQNGGVVTSFTNAGTIIADLNSTDGSGVGFFDDAGNNPPNASVTGSFTNSGTITGAGNGVFSRGGFDQFANSGTITGGIYSGVFTDGGVASFSNTGTITSENGGIGIDGAVGSFDNSGTLYGGSGNGVTLQGFVGGVTNSGTIEGSSGIRFNLPGPGGNTLINSGIIRGTGGTAIAFDDGAAGDDLLRIETGSQIFGDVEFGGGNDTFDFADFSGNTLLNAYGLENIVSGDRAYFDLPNDQLAIIEKNGIVGATEQVTADMVLGITQMLRRPGFTDTAGSMASDSALMGYAASPAPTPAAAAIADAEASKGFEVWGSLIGGASHDEEPVEIDHRFGGLVAGSHAQVMPGTTLGIVGAFVGSMVDTNAAGQTIESEHGILGIYGTTEVSIAEVNFALLGGFSDNHSERDLVALGAAETAVADYGSWFISPSLGVAVPLMVNDAGELRVAANATYVGGNVSAYDETGSLMNLSVGSASIGLIDARIGLEGLLYGAPTAFGEVQFSANAGLFVQSNVGNSSAPVVLLGQTQEVSLPGTTSTGVYGGAGLNVAISQGVDINLGVEGRWRDDGLLSGSAELGITAKF